MLKQIYCREVAKHYFPLPIDNENFYAENIAIVFLLPYLIFLVKGVREITKHSNILPSSSTVSSPAIFDFEQFNCRSHSILGFELLVSCGYTEEKLSVIIKLKQNYKSVQFIFLS